MEHLTATELKARLDQQIAQNETLRKVRRYAHQGAENRDREDDAALAEELLKQCE